MEESLRPKQIFSIYTWNWVTAKLQLINIIIIIIIIKNIYRKTNTLWRYFCELDEYTFHHVNTQNFQPKIKEQ